MAKGEPEVIVPGFPEIVVFQPMCRVCQLARTKAGLVEIIHKYRREEGLGVKVLAARIETMLERHGEKPMHGQVLARHFANHVDLGIDALAPGDDFVFGRGTTQDAAALDEVEVELLKVNAEDAALGKDESDYHNMWDLFRRVMRRVAALDSDPTAFITGEGKHDMQKLSIWTAMINTAAGVLNNLNKMRNSDRLTVSILETHTKSFTVAVAAPLAESLKPIQLALAQHPDPAVQALGGQVLTLLQSGVVDIFRRAAEESLRRSKEQFKLLN